MALKAAAEALERTANESLQGQPVGTPPKEALANVEGEMARVLLAIEEATARRRSPLPDRRDSFVVSSPERAMASPIPARLFREFARNPCYS